MDRLRVILFLVVAAGVLVFVLPPECSAGDLRSIAAAVPRRVGGFAADGPDVTYDRKTLFD